MKKENILEEKLNIIEWCQTLKEVHDDIWFQSFKNGTWGIADVISHFIIWDDFVIKYRIPYFLSAKSIPYIPTDVEEMNKSAIIYARSGISREELINEFSYTRKQLVDEIERIPVYNFNDDFQIGTKKVRLNHYFSSLIQHDLKHKEEIIRFLIHNQV
ncbi:DinB family protein [Bacillus albus]|uniref:DinB family protein n=1 Tax=Bacillus TaxID=1386 RepID=UPI0020007366|nr:MULTISPECIES: DinB family protein [Bacillus]MDA2029597.1 DinB family protein [Bacillus cereus group sp. Bcc03]MDA2219562.1 DinB family protein [Bacillus cereus group sp. Bc228]MDA2230302.1 DinB family protein [Bacillus cereus group sp. Bc227]MDA2263898.1 DinB family protein [Bacillus cereus group sp. Bc200]MDA2324467.1 DinB family protein [Bacillus cereus group sp. Bc177]